jgi:hypothetical protein
MMQQLAAAAATNSLDLNATNVSRHSLFSQADPVKGGWHRHWPELRLHLPRLLHSASAWAFVVADGMSPIALPAGHTPVSNNVGTQCR